eukprot:511757_1
MALQHSQKVKSGVVQFDQLQHQVKALQNQLEQVLTNDEKKSDAFKFVKMNTRIKLIISSKEFVSNAYTLFNKKHGNTLFIQAFDKYNQDELKIQEGQHDDKHLSQANISKITELYFDRNPDLFQYIIDYMRDYNIQHSLRELTVIQLEKLQDDALYFQINTFYAMIRNILRCRFNKYSCSPLIQLSSMSTVAERLEKHDDNWQCIALCDVLSETECRYNEFNIVEQGEGHIMIGVTDPKSFRLNDYAGGTMPGCSIYTLDGNLYSNKSNKEWGENILTGDTIGVLLENNKIHNTATVAFYINGKLQNEKIDLKQLMDVDKGIIIVVAMYTANDIVHLSQNVIAPQ